MLSLFNIMKWLSKLWMQIKLSYRLPETAMPIMSCNVNEVGMFFFVAIRHATQFLWSSLSWVAETTWLAASCPSAHLRHAIISQNHAVCHVLLLPENIQTSFPSIPFVN